MELPFVVLLIQFLLTSGLKRVLVIGGSGRVGGSAVISLYQQYFHTTNVLRGSKPRIKVSVGGRELANWNDYRNVKKVPEDYKIGFEKIDINDEEALSKVIQKYDLIIHTAGPFQGIRNPNVLESCLQHGKLYLDVCDDIPLSTIMRSKRYQELAQQFGSTAIISTGIWPGCSSLLAQQLVQDILRIDKKVEINEVQFAFFTAGSGGAGPTILSATFLILGEDVLIYRDNQPTFRKSASDTKLIDFGPVIGQREVARLNLIECESCHVSGIPNVETFFGTAPAFWNTLFVLMANIIPQKVLKNRNYMNILGRVSLPMVRLVDQFVGSKNAIRVDIHYKLNPSDTKYQQRTAILSHEDMEKAVGDAICSFATQLLFPHTSTLNANPPTLPYGVFFPEEIAELVPSLRENVLDEIQKDAICYDLDWKDSDWLEKS